MNEENEKREINEEAAEPTVEETVVEETVVEEPLPEETADETVPDAVSAEAEREKADLFRRAIEQAETEKRSESRKKNRLAALCIVLAGITVLSVGLAVLSAVFGVDKVVPFSGKDAFKIVEKETTRNIYVRDGLSTDALAPQELYDKVMPSIVTVTAYDDTGKGAYGTGFFISKDGWIATAAHVVAGYPNVYVTLSDGSCQYAADVSYDEASDVGLIKISGTGYQPLPIVESSSACPGDTLYAVGSPSGPTYAGTFTSGHVSYVDRLLPNKDSTGSLTSVRITLQVDSSLNPGNSGGPLLNDKGQVVGIISSKLNAAESMCFAIPSTGALTILNALKEDKTVTEEIRSGVIYVSGKLGVTAKNGTIPGTQTHAVELATVDPSSGLYGKVTVNDREQVFITAINGSAVVSMDTFSAILMTHRKGETVTLSLTLCHVGSLDTVKEQKEISVTLV